MFKSGQFVSSRRIFGKSSLISVVTISLSLLLSGCGGGAEKRQSSEGRLPSALQPRTTIVLSEAGETLADVAHRTGFSLTLLESLNPERVGQRLSRGIELRCPVGQPGIRNVESRP